VYENKKAKFGIVYNPILNELFYAESGKGAYKNDKKIKVSNFSDFQRALIATGFPYSSADNKDDLNWVIDKLSKILPKCQDIRRFGSAALDLCYVAEGKFDGYYEINLKPWDVSAGIIILKESGGVVTNENENEYDMFEDKCIVASNGIIHKEFLKFFDA
jgi:myo-inositol-1(or 4)-monophosphatase